MSRARHRHRRSTRGRLAATALVLALAGLGGAMLLRTDPAHPAPRPSAVEPALNPAGAPETAASATPASATPLADRVAFARAGGLNLLLPAPEVVAVCYHQATFDDAMTLHPLGHLERNANRWMFDPPPETPGPDYIVMSPRGRGTPATSAVDVVLAPGTPVLSPVSGRVTKAKPYRLYGRYRDWRVEIAPQDHPDLRVVVIHLIGVRVRRGDHLSATLSVIGLPREFGFRSQVDDYVPGGDPHVHIEIKEPAAQAAP